MLWNKHRFVAVVMFLLVIFMVACQSEADQSSENNNNQQENNEPVNLNENEGDPLENETLDNKQFSEDEATIYVATPWGEEGFNGRIGDYASEKLPHLTIEHINWDGSADDLEEIYANEMTPDVFLAFTGQQPLEQLDSVFGLDEMIESYGIDLSHIQDVALNEIRSRDKDLRLVGIPQETTLYGLYYNKEIFDLFGEEYPSPDESMTWDELMNLSAKFNEERNNIRYCGLNMDDLEESPLAQLSVNKTDPETGEVLLTVEPAFTKYMELMDRYFNLPGNFDEDCSFYAHNTAMKISWQGGGFDFDEPEALERIEVSPLPVWDDLPGTDPAPSGHPWAINDFSENKDAALQFILEATSEEYWTKLAKTGTPAPSSTGVPNQDYGSESEHMQGKNVAAFFVNTPANPPERKSIWDRYVSFDFEEFVESGVDIQEFLRVTKEEAEIAIQEAMESQ